MPSIPSERASYEDIAAKAMWEGGLEEGLAWFKPHEVPEEIQELWNLARNTREELEELTDKLAVKFREAGVEFV